MYEDKIIWIKRMFFWSWMHLYIVVKFKLLFFSCICTWTSFTFIYMTYIVYIIESWTNMKNVKLNPKKKPNHIGTITLLGFSLWPIETPMTSTQVDFWLETHYILGHIELIKQMKVYISHKFTKCMYFIIIFNIFY